MTTFHIPKTAAHVTIQDAGAFWTITVSTATEAEPVEQDAPPPAEAVPEPEPAPEPAPPSVPEPEQPGASPLPPSHFHGGEQARAVRRRELNRQRQARYRARHAPERYVTHPVTLGVTHPSVTPSVTSVTPSVTREVCVFSNINNINNIQEKHTQPPAPAKRNAPRNADRNAPVTPPRSVACRHRAAPPRTQQEIPLVEALPDVLNTPAFRLEWEQFVSWRDTRPQRPRPGYWPAIIHELATHAQERDLTYAVGCLRETIDAGRLHQLFTPSRATLAALAVEPSHTPVPEWQPDPPRPDPPPLTRDEQAAAIRQEIDLFTRLNNPKLAAKARDRLAALT